MHRAMIQLRNVSRVYPLKGGPYYALRGINLKIEEGDFFDTRLPPEIIQAQVQYNRLQPESRVPGWQGPARQVRPLN